MPYYHDLITEKSWQILQELRRRFHFIVIGGWAVYLYTKALKSRDIDFICSYEELQRLKENYSLIKNDRLKKYEIRMGDFDVDIYTPFFSELGIPVEDLEPMVNRIEGFTVLQVEPLLILKQKAYQDRQHSLKGGKDKVDIVALLRYGVDFKKYRALLKKYRLQDYEKELVQILDLTREVPELNLSAHSWAKFKKVIKKQVMSLHSKLKFQPRRPRA